MGDDVRPRGGIINNGVSAGERSGNRGRLEAALENVCGAKVPLQLRTTARVDAAEKPAPPRASRRQQQLEITNQPFVQKAMELFDGDPARLRYVPPEK